MNKPGDQSRTEGDAKKPAADDKSTPKAPDDKASPEAGKSYGDDKSQKGPKPYK
jgi:hypothetical protein